ncbi:DUF91 domain-containing protein [Candidatus Peregrinibacteria bacterium]|nr:DUF91 domain-containing protein [Candidatus Peregrinibacteria bacterium]
MWGYKLDGPTKGGKGWVTARNAIKEMAVGDMVVVALRGHRIGRLGEITGKAIEDDKWEPLVPSGPKLPDGEMGRRIFLRWELITGPYDTDLVVKLPSSDRFTIGELRPTASRISSRSVDQIRSVMNDPTNWVSLLGKFGDEKALSDYIASYPGRLEDGLLPHPNARIRELVFKDRTRLDVLLIDRKENPVIVECKQHGPTSKDIKQLRHYIFCLQKETGQKARGILVHGGAQKLSEEIIYEARKKPFVEVVSYRINVDFG